MQGLVFRDTCSVQKSFSGFFPVLRIFKISTYTTERSKMNRTKLIMIHVSVLELELASTCPAQRKKHKLSITSQPHRCTQRGVQRCVYPEETQPDQCQRSNVQTFVLRSSSSREAEMEATPLPHRNTRQHLQELPLTPSGCSCYAAGG